MGSTDVVGSGKFAGQKSNFAQTCSLLSQYLKEKGGFGDLSLGFNRNFQPNGAQTKTMNLLPTMENKGQTEELPATVLPENLCARMESGKAQMTIFYAGQVIVLNDFPADKAKEIMDLASKGTPLNPNTFNTTAVVPTPRVESASKNLTASTASNSPSFGNILVQDSPLPTNLYDLPIARKASLARFLEKRKARITSKAPYQTANQNVAVASEPTKTKTWLGLASKFRVQMDHHMYHA